MKKSIVSVFAAALVAGLVMSAYGAVVQDTHPKGVVDIKVTNMSHHWLKSSKQVTFGPKFIDFTVKENTFHKALGYNEMGSFVVKYEYDKTLMPKKHGGTGVKFVKAYHDKYGKLHYSTCCIKVAAVPGKPLYSVHGSLCKHFDITTSSSSGATSYIKATYK